MERNFGVRNKLYNTHFGNDEDDDEAALAHGGGAGDPPAADLAANGR